MVTMRGRKKRASPADSPGGTREADRPAAVATTQASDVRPGPPAAQAPAAQAPDAQPATDATEQSGRRPSIGDLGPMLLLRAAHPRQALLTALGLAAAAALAGRPLREVGLVFATVLVGQAILGWHNDLVDRDRDALHHVEGKPVAEDRIDPGTVWFSLACGLLLLVPLSLSNGLVAGSAYLIAVAIGFLGN